MSEQQKIDTVKEMIRQLITLNIDLIFTFKKLTNGSIPTQFIKIKEDADKELETNIPLHALLINVNEFNRSVDFSRGLYAIVGKYDTYKDIASKFNKQNEKLIEETNQIIREENQKERGHLYVVS